MPEALLSDADLGLSYPATSGGGGAPVESAEPGDLTVHLKRQSVPPLVLDTAAQPVAPAAIGAPIAGSAAVLPQTLAPGVQQPTSAPTPKLLSDEDLGIKAAAAAPGYGEDVAKSIVSGVDQGALHFLTTPRAVRDAATAGETWLADKVGLHGAGDIISRANDFGAGVMTNPGGYAYATVKDWLSPPKQGRTESLPSFDDAKAMMENVGGRFYEPQTVPGEYAKTIGEFVPGAGRNLVTGALIPAVVSETAGQATKGTPYEPYARLAGALGGGVAAAGAPAAFTAAKHYVDPLTAGGQEALAARTLAGETADVPATRDALDQPSEIVPGSTPTTFQATGDPGLGQFERKLRNSSESAPAFIGQDQSQNAARMEALRDIQPGGSPVDVASRFTQMRDELDNQAQARIDALTPTAHEASSAIGGQGTAESTGYALRQPMAEARAAAKAEEDKLWGLVNQDAGVPTRPIAAAANAIRGGVSESAPPLGAEEARILDVASRYGGAQRFGDLKDLRSSITDATAEARRAGQTQTVRRLTQLRVALDGALDHAVENQAALEEIAVRRGLLAPENTIDARARDFVQGYFERQQQARLASGARRADGARGTPSSAPTGVPSAEGEGGQGRRTGGGNEGAAAPAGRGADRPQVEGSIAYQAPDLGGRTVSARMHAPETADALGQDVPGTLVRPFGGPLEGSRPTGVVAYHGTPHEFERFSSARIGSGEGNQSYGHGLYFAQDAGVASGYRDALAKRDADLRLNNQGFRRADLPGDVRDAFDHIKDSGGNIDTAISEARAASAKKLGQGDMEGADHWMRRAATLEDMKDKGFARGGEGHLYQVRLNRPEQHFLDWDTSLKYQSPEMQRAIETIVRKIAPNSPDVKTGHFKSMSGGQIYQNLSIWAKDAPTASKMLADNGVAGVKYFDAGSRDARLGTRNYAVFNDHDIQITHKNGVALAHPVVLPQMLMGQARGAFVKELVGIGLNPESFSRDLRVRADRYLKPGMHLDHGTAFEKSAIGRMPQEDADAIFGGSASRSGQTNAGAGEAGAGEGRRLRDAGEGLRGSGETGGAPGEGAPVFGPEDVAAYSDARAATRERAQTFDEGTAGRILKPASRGGYQMPDAAVPSAVVPSGKPADAQAVRQFLAAGGAPEALSDATAYAIRSIAKRPDGTLDPNKTYAWLSRNKEALAEMPPEVSAKFKTVADTQAAVDAMVAKRAADLDAFNKTAMARVANLQSGDDVVKTINGIFGQKNAVQQMRSLAEAASGDPAAKEGLRRAIVEALLGRLTTNSSANASGVNQIKSDTYLGFMRKNGAVLREVFEPKELDMMAAIGNDLDRAARTHQTKGLTSSPGTAQDLGAKSGSILGEIGKQIGPAGLAMASHAAGANILTSGLSFLGAQTLGRMRAAGIANANELVLKAMLDPALAKPMLDKALSQQARVRSLGDQFVRISRATAAGSLASVPAGRGDRRERLH